MTGNKIRLFLATAILAGSALVAGAQTRERVHEVSAFSTIDVKNGFEVTVAKGGYGVKLIVDTALSDYVSVYVKGYTLYIACDEKAIPKEVKKMYRGKNAPVPVLRAMVYTPVLEGVNLDDQATLTGADTFEGNSFSMFLTGKSQVKSLMIHASSAKLQLKKNAEAMMSLDVDGDLDATAENASRLRLDTRCRNLNLNSAASSQVNVSSDVVSALMINSEGSSQMTVGVNAAQVYISATGSSKVATTGTASSLKVQGARSCNIDAVGLPVPEAEVVMNSGTVQLTPEKTLTVDLTGGSSVYYNSNPEIRVTKVIKSTLAPYGTK